MTENRFSVTDRPAERRYVLVDNDADGGPVVVGEEPYVDVAAEDGTVERVMYHTGVSDDYAGQGLASVLVRASVEDAIGAGRRIVPVCPYVKKWLPRHSEYAGHVDGVKAEHLQAVRERTAD